MLTLTALYLIHSVYCLAGLQPNEFSELIPNPLYAREIYEYSLEIEWIKIAHSFTLMLLAIFIVKLTSENKLLSTILYTKLLVAAVVVTLIYFVPVVVICVCAYKDAGESYFKNKFTSQADYMMHSDKPDYHIAALSRYADWMIMLMKRTDFGLTGLCFQILIQIQIYVLLFFLQWATF